MSLIREAWKHYGKENQLRKLQEECGELIQAVNKHLEQPVSTVHLSNLCEEICDVELLLDQVKEGMALHGMVVDHSLIKCKRLRKRMDG